MSARDDDAVWKALSDATRRGLIDALAERAHTTGELVDRFPDLSRTGVMKHLDVLEAAGLLIVEREGRTRWNHLNVAPLQRVFDAWVAPRAAKLAAVGNAIKKRAEARRGGRR